MIGLTGGIGSGKSTIAHELTARGYTVYDTDSEAKRLIVEDASVREAMTALFGSDIYDHNTYRTDKVAAQVFANPELLAQLNAIVHPAVRKDIINRQPDFIESAILYESGFNEMCEAVVAVIASKTIRLQRVMQRDGTDINKVRARMRAQMSNCHLRAIADYIVENDGKRSVERLVTNLLKRMELPIAK
ncbi:MAG: dephospho-CoA kinase [Paludibacteraceae bacterium]|nr:dephospho-CoA kinase [Paludibacteraceae bacterium]